MLAIILLGLLVALAGAALLWGADSREELDSREWAKRKEWYGKVA